MEDLYLPPRSRKTLQQINQSDSENAEDKKAKKKKTEESEGDGSDEESDEERPKRRGRPKKCPFECEKPFSDAEVCLYKGFKA